MNNENFIRENLYIQKLPVSEFELPFICRLLYNINQAGNALHAFPDLNLETSITIVDKELMQ
ncbi:hypothetical protein ACDX78_01360 [Virgibacillus oceani]